MLKRKNIGVKDSGVDVLGGKRLPAGERKESMTISIKRKLIDQIREVPGYNKIIEEMIENFLKKNKD